MRRTIPHEAIRWALVARHVREHFLRHRSVRGSASKDLTLGAAVQEAALIITLGELLQEIELGLKERLERHLRKTHGPLWWDQLPKTIRRHAKSRRIWSSEQLGVRRVLGPDNIAWLTMGDVVRVLTALPDDEWRSCLAAETSAKKSFEKSIRRVKAFRDYHVAHPKARPTTNSEIAALCIAIERLPTVVTPVEWSHATFLLERLAAASPDDREAIWELASSYGMPRPFRLTDWLSCPELESPGRCRHRRRLGKRAVAWRYRLLRWCAYIDVARSTFFSRRVESSPPAGGDS
jgi:hypothetical protein